MSNPLGGKSTNPRAQVEVNTGMEIAIGLALGTAVGLVWKVWANGEYAKMDAFNERLREAKKKGTLE